MSTEIPDFMSPEEADHIIDLAEEFGFAKSDIHLDPVAKKHAKTLRSTEGNHNLLAGEMGSDYSTHSAFFLEIIFCVWRAWLSHVMQVQIQASV